jgi:hypothetical protein
MSNIRCLDTQSAEWERAWQVVHNTPIAIKKPGPVQSLEHWMYMGTYRDDATSPWYHQFRHRFHPATAQRVIINVPCEDESAISRYPYY